MLGGSQKPVYFRWKTHQLALSRLFQSSNLWNNFTIKHHLMLRSWRSKAAMHNGQIQQAAPPHQLEIWGWLRVNGLKFTLVCTWHCAWTGCTFCIADKAKQSCWGKVGWPVSSFFKQDFFWYVFKHLKVLSYITYLGDRLECTVCWFAGKRWAS